MKHHTNDPTHRRATCAPCGPEPGHPCADAGYPSPIGWFTDSARWGGVVVSVEIGPFGDCRVILPALAADACTTTLTGQRSGFASLAELIAAVST